MHPSRKGMGGVVSGVIGGFQEERVGGEALGCRQGQRNRDWRGDSMDISGNDDRLLTAYCLSPTPSNILPESVTNPKH